ncbi:hypothetical protein [Candidatus Harpocratesius sp.]
MKKYKKVSILAVCSLSKKSLATFHIKNTPAIEERNLKKTVYMIDWNKITDRFNSKYFYTMKIAVSFAQIYGSYRKVFTTDSNYDDGINDKDYHNIASFKGGTTNLVNIIIYDGGENCNYTSDYCYAPNLSESRSELKVYVKLRTSCSYQYVIHIFGGSLKYDLCILCNISLMNILVL